MAESILNVADRWWSKDTVAIVTGSNRGLGYEIILELARRRMTVILTARDAERGLKAMDSAVKEEPELAEYIHFHQLDITNEQSVTELVAWSTRKFGGIDILVNNAAKLTHSDTYEDAVKTLDTNYFGTKRVTEKLLPLLRPSPHGARILMITSSSGRLEGFKSNESVKLKIQEAVDHLDKNLVDALVDGYLQDVKTGRIREPRWTCGLYHYCDSKLFLGTYTRILARELLGRPEGHMVFVNTMCPGGIDSDMLNLVFNKLGPAAEEQIRGTEVLLTAKDAASPPVWLALLPKNDCPQGKYFIRKQESTF